MIEPAKGLKTIMAKEGGFQHDFGVSLFPTPPSKGKLTTDQKKIFEYYGYDFARW